MPVEQLGVEGRGNAPLAVGQVGEVGFDSFGVIHGSILVGVGAGAYGTSGPRDYGRMQWRRHGLSDSLASWLAATGSDIGLVFSDVVDSTELLFQRETVAYRTLLRRHRARARGLATEHLGRIVEARGDEIFAALPDAGGALAYARALHRAPGADGLHVRVGVHLGHVLADGDALVGRNVHLAARVMQRGVGAEIWMSDAARDALGRDGFEDQNWIERDLRPLKGVPGEHRLWRLA